MAGLPYLETKLYIPDFLGDITDLNQAILLYYLP